MADHICCCRCTFLLEALRFYQGRVPISDGCSLIGCECRIGAALLVPLRRHTHPAKGARLQANS